MNIRNRKKPFIGILVWVLLFSMTAAGFPAAVHGSELEALSETVEAQTAGEEAVYTSWDDLKSTFGTHNHALALEAGVGSIAIDGSLGEWAPYAELRLPQNDTQLAMTGWSGPEDVSASVYMAYDEQYFYWAARVTDNVHAPVADSTMWRGDSIQFAFSPDGTYGPEYGINYMDGQAHVWQFSEGKATAGAALITAAAVQNGNETVYEVRMPGAPFIRESRTQMCFPSRCCSMTMTGRDAGDGWNGRQGSARPKARPPMPRFT